MTSAFLVVELFREFSKKFSVILPCSDCRNGWVPVVMWRKLLVHPWYCSEQWESFLCLFIPWFICPHVCAYIISGVFLISFVLKDASFGSYHGVSSTVLVEARPLLKWWFVHFYVVESTSILEVAFSFVKHGECPVFGESDGNRSRCGRRCVAGGFSFTNTDGGNLHPFPLDRPAIPRQWVTFVKVLCKDWERPTQHHL